MVWKTKPKDLDITSVIPRQNSDSNVVGRAPAISTIKFSPMELFGAAARCSHLHTVNPAIVSPESAMIAALLEQHVDDTSANFAILASANNFKDFIKSYFTGTVAAGVAYLTMINDGYIWADHFRVSAAGVLAPKQRPISSSPARPPASH